MLMEGLKKQMENLIGSGPIQEETSAEYGGVPGESQMHVPLSQMELGTIPKESAWSFDSVPEEQNEDIFILGCVCTIIQSKFGYTHFHFSIVREVTKSGNSNTHRSNSDTIRRG